MARADALIARQCNRCGKSFKNRRALECCVAVHCKRCDSRFYESADGRRPVCLTQYSTRLCVSLHLTYVVSGHELTCAHKLAGQPILVSVTECEGLDELDKVFRRRARKVGRSHRSVVQGKVEVQDLASVTVPAVNDKVDGETHQRELISEELCEQT